MVKRETGPGDGLTVSVNPPLFSELRAAQRETRSRIPPRTTCSAQPVSTGYPEKSARKRRSKHFVGFFFGRWPYRLSRIKHPGAPSVVAQTFPATVGASPRVYFEPAEVATLRSLRTKTIKSRVVIIKQRFSGFLNN